MTARPSLLRARRALLIFALVAVLNYLAVLLSLKFAALAEQVSPVWLPSGIAFWAYLRFGRSALPAIFVSTFVGSLFPNPPFVFGLSSAISNTIEPVIALYLARRFFDFRPKFERVKDVVGLLVGASIGGPMIGSLFGASVMALYGWAPDASFLSVWLTWWSGDGIGILVVAPALLTLPSIRLRHVPRKRVLEVLLFATLLVLTEVFIFRNGRGVEAGLYTQTFLLFPFIVWAGLRLGPAGAAWMTLTVAAAAVFATRAGIGPFSQLIPIEGAIVVQIFLILIAVTGLLLAATSAERGRASVQARFLATAIRDTQDAVVIASSFDERSVSVEYANDAFTRLSGMHADTLIRWTFDEPGEDPERLAALKSALRSGVPFLSPWSLHRADGPIVETELQVSPVKDTEGRRLFVFTFRDVSELKRMEAKLILAERLSSMGMVAAGVGHEINNPLGFVLNHLQMVEAQLEMSVPDAGRREQLRTRLREATFGTERIASIVQSLKVLSREAASELSVIELAPLLRRMLELAAHRIRERGTLVLELDDSPRVRVNEARLGQVFLNLVLNAVQSLPEDAGSSHEVRIRSGTAPDGRAFFEVCDSGRGIPQELRARIFEPFFTTKAAGEGTGLGLFIARQIVHEQGGDICVFDNEFAGSVRGACFRVLLPAETAPASPEPPATAELPAPEVHPRARILIIDDEVRLATSLRMLLESTHDVVALNDGQEALSRLLSPEPFDVILCDLQMPHLSGMELYRRLEARDPERAARIIFFSGGAYTREAQQFLATVKNPVLDKPVPLEKLLTRIDETLKRLGRWRAGGTPRV